MEQFKYLLKTRTNNARLFFKALEGIFVRTDRLDASKWCRLNPLFDSVQDDIGQAISFDTLPFEDHSF